MLVQVTKTSSVSLYNLHLQSLQTPSMLPSIPMEISSLVQYFGFAGTQHPLKMQYINSFIQSKRKVGLHTLDNHSPWTLHSFSLNFTFAPMEMICHKTGFHLLILNCWANCHCFNTEVTYLQALLLTELLSGWNMFLYKFMLTFCPKMLGVWLLSLLFFFFSKLKHVPI